MTFPLTIVLRYGRFEPEDRRLPQAANDYQRWFLGRLRTLDARLCEHDWLCTGRFTTADVSVGYALMLASTMGMETQFPASVQRYWRQLRKRDGYRRACAAELCAAGEQGVSLTPAPVSQPL